MWWWLPAPPVWTTWPISWPEQTRTGPRCRCSAALFGVSGIKLHAQYCAPRSWAKARAHEVFAHHVRLPRRGEKMAHLVFLLCFCIAKIHRISRCIFLCKQPQVNTMNNPELGLFNLLTPMEIATEALFHHTKEEMKGGKPKSASSRLCSASE